MSSDEEQDTRLIDTTYSSLLKTIADLHIFVLTTKLIFDYRWPSCDYTYVFTQTLVAYYYKRYRHFLFFLNITNG